MHRGCVISHRRQASCAPPREGSWRYTRKASIAASTIVATWKNPAAQCAPPWWADALQHGVTRATAVFFGSTKSWASHALRAIFNGVVLTPNLKDGAAAAP